MSYQQAMYDREQRNAMKKAYEEYRDTGMLGGYNPNGALLRETESGEVLTSFRDTCYQHQGDHIINQREMLIEGKVFHVISVFLMEATATPTDKLLSLIDTDPKEGNPQRVRFPWTCAGRWGILSVPHTGLPQ